MFKAICFICVLAISFNTAYSQKFSSYFKRSKWTLSYDRLDVTKKWSETNLIQPDEKLRFHNIAIGYSVYLPVYKFMENFSIGVDPALSLNIYGFVEDLNAVNYPDGQENVMLSNWLIFSATALAMVKYNGEASLSRENFPLGVGAGIGYQYLFPIAEPGYAFAQPVIGLSVNYMIQRYDGVEFKVLLPLQETNGDFNMTMKNTSYSLCIIGWVGI